MTLPPLDPSKTLAGIAVDPRTLARVIPESKRPDGTVRKQIKIRPGFTPQEDVSRFRGSRQAQMDSNALPKGHIIGWAPPPTSAPKAGGSAALSKSAKKNAKRKEKREKKGEDEAVPDNWDDEEEGGQSKLDDVSKRPKHAAAGNTPGGSAKVEANQTGELEDNTTEDETQDPESLAEELDKLAV